MTTDSDILIYDLLIRYNSLLGEKFGYKMIMMLIIIMTILIIKPL